MKFTKKELAGLVKICDAVSKMKDSLESEIYSKMRSAYPDAISHKAISKGDTKVIRFKFNKEPNKKIVSILQSMGFKIVDNLRTYYELRKGTSNIFLRFNDNNEIELSIYE